MTLRSLLVTAALLAGLSLGRASAQSITTVTSSNDPTADATVSASVGSELTIDGTGFGTAKPKVFLTDAGNKKFALKVTFSSDVQIKATITKATAAGAITLNVQPKGVASPATSPVTIEAPAVGELQDPTTHAPITSADANAQFAITGQFFGTKKGKIKIGAKVAKVVSWLDGEIHVVMPKTLANGVWGILLDNKVATDADTQITTTNSDAKIGKVGLVLHKDGQLISLKYSAGASVPPWALAIVGNNGGNPNKNFTLLLPYLSSDPIPATYVFNGANFVATYLETNVFSPLNSHLWTAANGFTVTINANSGGQAAGTFTGTFTSANAAPITIDGSFVTQF